jgi:uncharacterized protein (UPF0276 family)
VQELGVGLVYWEPLAPVFEPDAGLVQVLEVEPQTLWEKCGTPEGLEYRVNDALLNKIARLPQAKLAHGVAHPLGGTTPDPLDHVAAWKHTLDVLNPVWVSEHLSFNRCLTDEGVEEAGFLLPPRQTAAGVERAAYNIARMREVLGYPLAFETGVNYFQPRSDELPDGEYFGRIAHRAQCGILLDLHNLWVNEQNGRQTARDALKRIPLEQVWEVHLAGGMKLGTYWLDAHSGGVPEPVMELAAEVLPQLPNVGALIFEILPEHLPNLGIDGVCRQLEALHALWKLRSPRKASMVPAGNPSPLSVTFEAPSPSDMGKWECTIVDLLRGRPLSGPFADLENDPGSAVLRQLVGEFRRAAIVRTLRYSLTALLVSHDAHDIHELIETYCREYPADMYAALEGHRFATFLASRERLLAETPHLAELVAFEHALIRAAVFGASSNISWSVDPTQLFEALDEGRMPENPVSLRSSMIVAAEGDGRGRTG